VAPGANAYQLRIVTLAPAQNQVCHLGSVLGVYAPKLVVLNIIACMLNVPHIIGALCLSNIVKLTWHLAVVHADSVCMVCDALTC